MTRTVITIATLLLALASCALAQTPQAEPTVLCVSVVHAIDVQRMVETMRRGQNLRIGVAGTAPRYIYNVTTGLVIDDQGHVVTRLSNADPQDKEPLTITTTAGTTLTAKLIGVDFATGFAVLDVASLKGAMPKIAAAASLANGSSVRILSSDVVPKSVTDKVYLSTSINVSQGRVLTDSIYSKARGALTLLSDSFMARGDGSVVVTLEDQIVGIAQYAGFGRAYLFPIDFIRDTVVKRVIEKNGNVPAGWLGVKGENAALLADSDAAARGLQRKAGVIVNEVTPESAAARAGIMPSDVITRVDDFDVAGTADLKALLSSLPAGRTVKVRALRDRQPIEINATLGPRPPGETFSVATFDHAAERDELEARLKELQDRYHSYEKSPASSERNEALRELLLELRQLFEDIRALGPKNPNPYPLGSEPASVQKYPLADFSGGRLTPDALLKAGFSARELTPQLAAMFHAKDGLLVTEIIKNSPADRAGLKAGDVIVGAQEHLMTGVAQLQALLAAQHGLVILKIIRRESPTLVSLDLQ
jgi:S1-C subfamily serine protease